MHVWQGDDVQGFLSDEALSGGISVTGNYPGAAHTPEELRQDLEKAYSLILETQIESSRHLFRHRGSSGSKWWSRSILKNGSLGRKNKA